MDNQIVQAVCVEDGMVSGSIGMSDFSDEILLSILRHVSTSDLVNNVSWTCRKLHTLCYDKTLLTTVTLSEEYTVTHTHTPHTHKSFSLNSLIPPSSGK